ncbi:hypothetical protein CC79DRAFT_1396337 [Sarocladium strictum]
MSLTKRNDGCPQCRNRRLRCDKTEPECLKCLKKGLRCSGQGFECRFSAHMSKLPTSPSSTPRRLSTTASDDTTSIDRPTPLPPPPVRRRRGRASVSRRSPQARSVALEEPLSSPEILVSTYPDILPNVVEQQPEEIEILPVVSAHPSAFSNVFQHFNDALDATGTLDLVLCRPLDPLSPRRRQMFQHFSDYIASKMVIYDWGTNGYRDIILPIAHQDETVSRAVCAVSAFHLGAGAGDMLATAEATQQAVFTKLVRDSMEMNPRRVFSLSTWAAIVVLLVGDTITGSTNYILLLEMLRHLVKSIPEGDSAMPENARTFLTQQTRMFELFGSALTSERHGLEVLTRPTEYYLDFFATCSTAEPRHTNLQLIRSAIMASCGLCVKRMQNKVSYICPDDELDSLKQLLLRLNGVDGEHALVWTCFVAAAESVRPEHREFFTDRLASLYGCTRFGTILQALEMLESIWEKQGRQKWTEFVTLERPILVM